ncbi:MAG: T9SS type A sorting domain-containing protein [Bacteroidetes bacterium]|nr:T9SS type A sorting domain-containing protein [Bacteroidota bacterium]
MKTKIQYFLFSILLLCCRFSYGQQDSLFSFFNVQQDGNKVIVFLTIRGGIQCSGLQVQRGTDSINYTLVHEFPGVCGSPSADESYVWVDDSPSRNTVNYYRLEIGNLGIVSEHKFVFFQYFEGDKLLITPNPCEDCTIRFPNDKREKVRVQLFSIDGKFLLEEESTNNFYSLKDFDLQGSTFLVSIIYENGKKITGRVLKF